VETLRQSGFEIVIETSFPFQTVPTSTSWYGSVQPDEKLDWFVIEMGIEINGKPYNLVPSLIEMLDQLDHGGGIESLSHLQAKARAVPLGDGRYVVVPWERLRTILEVLAQLCPPGSGRRSSEELDLPIARMSELTSLEDAFVGAGPELHWLAGSDWLKRARSLSEGPTWSPPPSSLQATLRPYQHEGLIWLEHLRDVGVGAVLADDMGLGKTLQTIALLTKEKEARRMDIPSLVVSPTSLVDNWSREFSKFAPHLRVVPYVGRGRHEQIRNFRAADVILTSYPILIRDLTPLTDREFHYVVIDEAQTIKNERSLASISVRSLSARHRVALSGTPVENNLGELWALFEFTHPGLLGRKKEFQTSFREPIEKFGDEERLALLKKRVAPFILRREKETVASDLPPKTEIIRTVELEGGQRDLYESIRLSADRDVRKAIAERGIGASTVTILDALMKLRQVCCDPRLVKLPSTPIALRSAKHEYFFRLVESQLAQGRRILVFSQFTRMLGILEEGLRARAVKTLCLTGSSRKRQVLVDAFEAKEADIFLISLKAGGTGLNLVSADTVIHYDPWWNAAAQMQATDRAYRIGQKRPVFVYNLIAKSSVEERMLTLQQRKRNLAETLFDGSGSPTHFDESEIVDLFAPLGDASHTTGISEDEGITLLRSDDEDEDDNALAL
jgi:SNF2 family DNA or RNA helicase